MGLRGFVVWGRPASVWICLRWSMVGTLHRWAFWASAWVLYEAQRKKHGSSPPCEEFVTGPWLTFTCCTSWPYFKSRFSGNTLHPKGCSLARTGPVEAAAKKFYFCFYSFLSVLNVISTCSFMVFTFAWKRPVIHSPPWKAGVLILCPHQPWSCYLAL